MPPTKPTKKNKRIGLPNFPTNTELAAAFSLSHLLLLRVWIDHSTPLENAYFEYTRRSATGDNLVGAWLGAAFFFLPLLWIIRKTFHPELPVRKTAVFVVMSLVSIQLLVLFSVFFTASLDPVFAKNIFASALTETQVWCLVFSGFALFLGAFLFAAEGTIANLRRFLVLLSPFPLLLTGDLLLLEKFPVTHRRVPAQTTPRSKSRVVIAMFDELDYDLAYLGPNAKEDLPEFFRFRDRSFHGTHALPPSRNTLLSLPAYWFGKNVTDIEVGMDLPPRFKFFGAGEEHTVDNTPTLFSRAKEAGARIGVVGWSHPYCEILGSLTDVCHQNSYLEAQNGRSWWESYGRAITRVFDVIVSLGMTEPRSMREAHLLGYERILAQSTALVADPSMDLVFLHLPVPHEPSLYSRAEKKLRPSGQTSDMAYEDNLVLADLTLGALRTAMQEKKLWDSTHVIVLSDHTYRTKRHGESEHDVATRIRIPFLWKPASAQVANVPYHKPFTTRIVAPFALELLFGHIESPRQAARWLDAERRADAEFLAKAYRNGNENCLEHPFRSDSNLFGMWTNFRQECVSTRRVAAE